MTTVGLELTSFIEPSLTWKRVSKGRSTTSRRSRNMKVVQEQEKRGPKRLNSLQSSEDSEKSNEMIHGRRFSGNMEHIPIKKRRLFFRSPSPPLQSPNRQGESEELVDQFTSDQCTNSNVSLESAPTQINISDGSKSKDINSDAINDESNVKSSDEVHGTGDDFSGIAILAAAACSDRLDNSSGHSGKNQSQLGSLLDKQQELINTESDVKESITSFQSTELPGKDEKHVEEVGVVDLPKDTVQISVNREPDVGMSLINASQEVEQNESAAITSVDKENLKLFDATSNVNEIQSSDGKDTKHVQEVPVVDSPKDIDQLREKKESDVVMSEINASLKVDENKSVASTSVDKEVLECNSLPSSLTDKTPENSGTSRDCRLHWDLNTVMDEWKDPVEDTGVVSSAQALEVAPMNIKDSQILENVDGCKDIESEIQNLENLEGSKARSAEAIENCGNITSQVEDSVERECTGSDPGYTTVSSPIFGVKHCSEVSSGFVTSILKENPSPSNANHHVFETPMLDTDREIQHIGVNEDANIDRSLSLGLSGIEVLASEETNNGSTSENANQVAEETPHLQIGTEIERGYDSHLEDGELREPHCWEDNEGEEVETEHVDYDSDNRDGIVFYEAGNDSIQFSEVLDNRECEKQSFPSENFSSDDKTTPDKSNEENCSLRFQGDVSTKDSMDASVCTKRDSPALKTCSGAINSDKVELDQKDCRSSLETESAGKDFENDPSCHPKGASASGRDLQFSDGKCADSMRRSSSSNFDGMHNSDGRDESRTQQPSVRMGRFGGRSWNPEQKSIVANATSEDDSDRIIRTTGDTSPLRTSRPRIINTSRGGYHVARRGSPGGERDGDFSMGMMKLRDFSPDNNPRNRFGRFNGMGRGGFREGYRRPNVCDTFKSGGGGPMMNRFTKRERSFSPVGDRFQRKSRSRSRTRSPDFRSEARMGRGRLPYQQSNHATEHPRERRSPPLRVFNQSQRFDTMGSPTRLRSNDIIRPTMRPMRFNDTTTSGRGGHDFDEGGEFRRKPILIRNQRRSRSRSRSCSPEFRSDTRMGPVRVPYQPATDQIRQRRSPPVRVFRPEQRYETGGSPLRLRSDECSRPMVRALRFPDSTQAGRGHDFNNNSGNVNGDEYRRKPRTIFERIHPVRHYEMDGDIRRFAYEEEGGSTQNFRRNEKYVRGPGERRPIEFRGPREERGSNVRYNNNNNNNNNSDRVFYSGPKQQFGGGMRDYGGEEGIPRRVRP